MFSIGNETVTNVAKYTDNCSLNNKNRDKNVTSNDVFTTGRYL